VRADDQVRQPVAVDVAGRRDADSARVKSVLTVDDEAAATDGNRREINRTTIGLAEDHVATAGIAAARRIAAVGADDQVAETVAVDVAGGRDCSVATLVTGALAIDDEATAAGGDCREVDGATAALAEDHVAAPAIDTGPWITGRSPDDQVGKAVAIDVARGRNTLPTLVMGTLAVDHETAAAVGNRRQVDGTAAGLAENHVAAPGTVRTRRIA